MEKVRKVVFIVVNAETKPDPKWDRTEKIPTFGVMLASYSFVKAADGAMIEIIRSNDRPRPEIDLRDAGLRHLALTVSDFNAVCERLKAKGVRFLSEPEVKGGNSVVFFTDPDGNILHLLQREKPLP